MRSSRRRRGKIQAIEQIDQHIVGPVWQALERLREKTGEPYRMLLLPDHPDPAGDAHPFIAPVPAVLFDSERRLNSRPTCAMTRLAVNGRRTDGTPRVTFSSRTSSTMRWILSP